MMLSLLLYAVEGRKKKFLDKLAILHNYKYYWGIFVEKKLLKHQGWKSAHAAGYMWVVDNCTKRNWTWMVNGPVWKKVSGSPPDS